MTERNRVEVLESESARESFEIATMLLAKAVANWNADVLSVLSEENVQIADSRIKHDMSVTNNFLGDSLTIGMRALKERIGHNELGNSSGIESPQAKSEIDPEALRGYSLRDALSQWNSATDAMKVSCSEEDALATAEAVGGKLVWAEAMSLQVHSKMARHGLLAEVSSSQLDQQVFSIAGSPTSQSVPDNQFSR